MHVPNICFGEARQAILTKCQPRSEADAIRRYLTWAQPSGHVTDADATAARLLCLEIFGLDDVMLDRATELALAGIAPKPFDHAILAGVLVRASRLWDAGERTISFCESDSDLQPWDKNGNAKPPLRNAFDRAHVWVCADFTLTQPQRRADFE